VVFVTAVSGLMLAHGSSVIPQAERPLRVTGSGSINEAKPINELLIASLSAVKDRRLRITTEEGGLGWARGPAAIERARFRPAAGTVQILLRDPQPLEVVLDWKTSQVLSVAPRHQQRWLRMHSAEAVLGEDGTFKRDAIAGLIVLMSLTAIGIWFRDRARLDLDRAGRVHRLLGLVAGLALLVPAVTGVLMNHRADLGFTYRPHREFEAEEIVRMTPARLPALVDTVTTFIAPGHPATVKSDIDWLDYFPRNGSVTVGFHDGTEVFADVYSGEVRAIMPPRDTWVRQIHSGRMFGAVGAITRDLTAILWIAVTCGGLLLMIRSERHAIITTIAPRVRHQLVVTTLLFGSAALFTTAAVQLSRLADGWTTWCIWLAALGVVAAAAAVGPWLWAQTVHAHRLLLAAILLGSGGGLLALLPGMSYLVVVAAQAALAAAVVSATVPTSSRR
jgi:hypothetical protein